jgi:hypothetical protein
MDQVADVGLVHVNQGSLQMSVAEKAGQLLIPERAAATRQRRDGGSLFRALYVAAIISATIGWLWLIASAAMRLF